MFNKVQKYEMGAKRVTKFCIGTVKMGEIEEKKQEQCGLSQEAFDYIFNCRLYTV